MSWRGRCYPFLVPGKNADDDDLWKVPARPAVAVAPADEPPPPRGQTGGLADSAGRRTLTRSVVPLTALFLMGFAHVLPVLVSGRVWARNDYGSSVVPAFATLTGRVPFVGAPSWAPHVFGGAPLEVLAAMPRYPLNVFAYLLEPPQALAVFVGLHLAIAGASAWFFIRRVAGASRSASLFGAMVYAFGGALWFRGMHPDYLAVAAWMPAVLRCTWDLCAAESGLRRRKFAALLGVFTALTLLIGGGAPIVMLTVLAALVMIWDGAAQRTDAGVPRLHALRDAVPWLGAGVGAGVLLAVPGWLPFLEVVLDGARGSLSVRESSAFGLLPQGWGRIVLPELGARWPWPYQVEPWVYFGVLTLPLALLAAVRDPRGRTLALWAIAALVAAIGILGPIHWLLYYAVPGYSLLRSPGRWVIVAGLAVGGLAARGLDAFLAGAGGVRRSGWILAAAIAVVALAAALAPAQDPLVRRGAWFLAAHAVLAAAWLGGAARASDGGAGPSAATAATRKPRFVAGAAVVLLAADFAGIVLRMPVDEPPSALEPPEVLAAAARESDGRTRIFHDDAAGPRPLDNGNRWGYRNARGYSQAVPESWSTLLDLGAPSQVRFTGWPERLDPRLLRLLGVGIYVGSATAAPPPGFSLEPFAAKRGLAAWKSLEEPFETAVVREVVVAPSRRLEAATAMALDTTRAAAVAEDVGLPARAPGSESEPAGTAVLERQGPERLRVRVAADGDALVVVGEAHHRRWRATVDGRPAPIVRANAVWMGVRVPAGEHEIVLACGPAVRWWMLLLVAAGVAALGWIAAPFSPAGRSFGLRARALLRKLAPAS